MVSNELVSLPNVRLFSWLFFGGQRGSARFESFAIFRKIVSFNLERLVSRLKERLSR